MSDNNNYVQINADGEDGLRVSNTESTFNEGGIDRDFRVESDTNSTAFTVNGGSGQIGLGRGESGSVNADQVTVFGTYGLMLESNDSSVADDEYIDLTLNSGGGRLSRNVNCCKHCFVKCRCKNAKHVVCSRQRY